MKINGNWYRVVRANAKTVSVPSHMGGNWTDTSPYRNIQDHRPKSD